jgi:hypothetical protein
VTVDRSETLARDHLVFRGYPNPVYEADGNVPPDFLLDGRIAVEVRRLNENEPGVLTPKGLEETEIPLLMGLQKLCRSFGPAQEAAWWLALWFQRPIPPWSKLTGAASRFLNSVKSGASQGRVARHIHDNVELEAIPRAGEGGDVFHVAVISDEDSGGWVLELLERNLRLCIDEKTAKVQSRRSRYPVWWLVLVDHVAYGLSEYDRAQFRTHVNISHSWDSVIVLNPLDHTHYFEL